MKAVVTAFLLAVSALGVASCGTSTCSEVCDKLQVCGVIPGTYGTNAASCTASCNSSSPRLQTAVRACVEGASCNDLRNNRCGGW